MARRRAGRGPRTELWVAALFAAGCARVVGLDLDGWQPVAPDDEAGAAGASEPGPGSGSGGEGGGAGGLGVDSSPVACSLPDARGKACCVADMTCGVAVEAPLACAPLGWTRARIPYVFADDVPACETSDGGASLCFRTVVRLAMQRWCEATEGQICYEERADADRVVTVRAEAGACYADGLDGPAPTLRLDPALGGGCDEVGYEHAVGHVLGLEHPHQRHDRDRYLSVDDRLVPCGCRGDVMTTCAAGAGPRGVFDYRSIMLYPTAAPAPAFFTDKAGHAVPRPGGPSPLDGSAALEQFAKHSYWAPFVALGADAGPSTPPDLRLPDGRPVAGSPATAVVWWGESDTENEQRLYVVARSDEGRLYAKSTLAPWSEHTDALGQFSASPWVYLGDGFDSDAAVAATSFSIRSGFRRDVVARRQDGQLYLLQGVDPEAGWVSLDAPPPGAASAPAAASSGPGRLDVVVRGGDNVLWARVVQGDVPVGPWRSLEAPLAIIDGKPAAAAPLVKERLDVVAVSQDRKRLVHFRRHPYGPLDCIEANDWWCASTYTLAGGVADGASPALAATGDGVLDAFLQMSGSFLWQKHFYEQWEPTWHAIGGIPLSDPAATSWYDPAISLYTYGAASPKGDLTEAPSPLLLERTWRPPPPGVGEAFRPR